MGNKSQQPPPSFQGSTPKGQHSTQQHPQRQHRARAPGWLTPKQVHMFPLPYGPPSATEVRTRGHAVVHAASPAAHLLLGFHGNQHHAHASQAGRLPPPGDAPRQTLHLPGHLPLPPWLWHRSEPLTPCRVFWPVGVVKSSGSGSKPIGLVIQRVLWAHRTCPSACLTLCAIRLQVAHENAWLVAWGDARGAFPTEE